MIYKRLIFPPLKWLSRKDPEIAHDLAVRTGKILQSTPGGIGLLKLLTRTPSKVGEYNMSGIPLTNPIGLAAGFDKQGEIPHVLANLFGSIELGAVLKYPQSGNPRPRCHRLEEEEGLLNWYSFNSVGVEQFVLNTQSIQDQPLRIPVGVNIGLNKEVLQEEDPVSKAMIDYCFVMNQVRNIAKWVTINVSSPNTPRLHMLQEPAAIDLILCNVMNEVTQIRNMWKQDVKVAVKVSGDVPRDKLLEIVAICIRRGVHGIIIGNTWPTTHNGQPCGKSGPALFETAFDRVKWAKRFMEESSNRISIVGCGGINSIDRAKKMLEEAGADSLQLLTALIYEGPNFPGRLARGLQR